MNVKVSNLRNSYNSGRTKSVSYRLQQLNGIKRFLIECEADISNTLHQDLGKSPIETFMTEISIITTELKYTIKHLPRWIKSRRVSTPLMLQPGRSYIYPEPLGLVLIIAPWNYPISLTLIPLIGAIAAGNCAIIKPSELAPATSGLLAAKLLNYIDPECIAIIEGGLTETTALLNEKVDHIFFTGSTAVGKKIMEAAAKQLTPVTLELGGKSPCIVDETADLDVAARRIAWAKFINAGQTCVAPDYVLVHESIESKLIAKLKQAIVEFYGQDPEQSPDYGRIINLNHCQRLIKLLTENGEIAFGGEYNENAQYIAPTILQNVSLFSPIMLEEIFGPILPLVRYKNIDGAINLINSRPKPLALYLFSNDKETKSNVINRISAGSMCINHALQQLANPELPFGGVGASGMGAYHGKVTFDTFTHYKSVLDKATFFDLRMAYPPYNERFKKILRWLT